MGEGLGGDWQLPSDRWIVSNAVEMHLTAFRRIRLVDCELALVDRYICSIEALEYTRDKFAELLSTSDCSASMQRL